MKRASLVVLLALLASLLWPTDPGRAHNGEYTPPNPPPLPKVERPGAVTPRGGVPTWRRRRPNTATPPGRQRGPGEVTPGPSTPEESGRSLGRRDDRFTWDLWWELDREMFLGKAKPLQGAGRSLALEALVAALGDESTIVRSRALVSLARLGDERVPAMARALIEKNEPGVHAATLALGIARGAGAGAGEGEPILELLKKLTMDESRSIGSRTLALTAIGLAGVPTARTFLREVVDEESRPNLRSAAAIALGLLRDEESVARLRGLLVTRRGGGPGDLDPMDDLVRCSAAFALGRIGTDAGRIALLNALEEGDGLAGGSAALALGRLGDPAARAALREAIVADRPYPTRALSIVALARIGDGEFGGSLLGLLQDAEIRSSELGGVVIAALGLVGSGAAADRLLEVFADEEVPVRNRAAAAAALGRLSARSAITPLTEALPKAKDPLLRAHVVLALARLSARGADEAIAENLELGKSDVLRRLTMDALAARGDPASAGRLVEAFAEPYFVHRSAVRAIARLDPARGVTGVLPRHEDETNDRARRFAADALGWLLTPETPAKSVVRDLNPLCGMPLIQALLYIGGEEFLYDMTLGL